jgi:two-component system NtrC family sensor kinase
MLKLRNITIKQKLTLILMFTCLVVLLMAITSILTWEWIEKRQDMVSDLNSHAVIIADSSKTEIISADKQAVTKILSALRTDPSVVYACIYDDRDNLFTEYQRGDITKKFQAPKPQKNKHVFTRNYLCMFKQIELDGEKIGSIYLQADLSHIHTDLIEDIKASAIIAAIVLSIAYFQSALLQKIVSGPILSLAKVAKAVSEKKDYAARAVKKTNDEVGLLIDAFNQMLEQIQQRNSALVDAKKQLEKRVRERTAELTTANKMLKTDITERKHAEEELRKAKEQTEKSKEQVEKINVQLESTYNKLMKASHQAGMTEVATDVLHNVGNVLNSVNVSATLITEKIMNSEVTNLGKLADMIAQHGDDMSAFLTKDPKGKLIPTYLSEVSKQLINEHNEIVEKLQSLIKNIEHIKEIVKMQQMYARASGVEISTTLEEIIEDAIQINHVGFERHKIKLTKEFQELGDITIDRQKVLQILVNLISNANYALKNHKNKQKSLNIKLYKHGESRIRIQVTDTGIGIPKENIKEIFRHGFTTKKHGHGFGLHSCALAAKEMGGSLTARSNGPGKGATFILELPLKQAEIALNV